MITIGSDGWIRVWDLESIFNAKAEGSSDNAASAAAAASTATAAPTTAGAGGASGSGGGGTAAASSVAVSSGGEDGNEKGVFRLDPMNEVQVFLFFTYLFIS